jgi:hypothetical protein
LNEFILRTAGIGRQFVELGLHFGAQMDFHTVSVEAYRAGVKRRSAGFVARFCTLRQQGTLSPQPNDVTDELFEPAGCTCPIRKSGERALRKFDGSVFTSSEMSPPKAAEDVHHELLRAVI